MLEVVEIEEHHAHEGTFPTCLGQCQFQTVQGQHPVGQPGQDVVVGLAQELLFIAFADADVFTQDEVTGGAAGFVLDRGGNQLLPEAFTITAHAVHFTLPDPDALHLQADGLPQVSAFTVFNIIVPKCARVFANDRSSLVAG